MALPSSPNTRKEMYLSNMAGQGTALPSEPHTREEEYLDYIAKNGGGGGTGDGDMKKSIYDADMSVAEAGGIADYVAGAITGKVSKSNTEGLLKNDGTVDTTSYQNRILDTPVVVKGLSNTAVEPALHAINNALDEKGGVVSFSNEFSVGINPDTEAQSVSANIGSVASGNTGLMNGGTVYTALQSAFPRSEQAVLGAKNRLRNTASSTTDHGVEFVVNNDKDSDLYKTVTIKQGGQATADIYFPIFPHTAEPEIPQGNYIISGGFTPPQDLSIKFYLNERNAGNTGWGNQWADSTGSGVAYTRSNDYRYAYFIFIKNGTQITSDIVVKPMVRLATDPDPTYVPYAMTNKELTENKADNSVISSYVENGTTASKAYGIGEHFIRNGLLGVAIQAIASGGTFTLNTNYREGNLSGLLTPVIISNAIDLDTLVASGIYYLVATPTHGPESISSFILLNFYVSSSTQIQVAIRGSGENIYVRTKTGGTWHEWYKFTGTALS